MSECAPDLAHRTRLVLRLNPLRWLRNRREQALECTLVCLLDSMAERMREDRLGAVQLTAAEFRSLREEVRRQHAARGLRYVGPFCSWRALLRFAGGQSTERPLVYAPGGAAQKFRVRLSPTADQHLAMRFEPAPEVEWSLEGTILKWERVTARPCVRR